MARKKKEDAQLTYSALLDAAEQVFFKNGVSKTTLNDIASAAGVTRGAIYWHFTDKADLLTAMFARAMLPMKSMLTELSQDAYANPLQALRTMCVQVLTKLASSTEQQRVFCIMFHRCDHVGPTIEILDNKRNQREECLTLVQTMLSKAVLSGVLSAETDVVMASQVICNFMVGTISEWLFAPKSYDLGICAPSMVNILIAGLQTTPPRIPNLTVS